MEPRIGVYVCHCGSNIAGTVDVEKVAEFARTLPSVVVSRDYKFMCSDPGQDLIKKDIKELGVNRVVVASCSPQMHEPTFRQGGAGRRPQPLLFRDGQYPRALLLGDRIAQGGHRKGQGAGQRRRAPRVFTTSRWRTRRCPSTPIP